jgi:hypothetical protein
MTRRAMSPKREIESHTRAVEAVKLRGLGLTYQQIADQLGYADNSGALCAVRTYLAKTAKETCDETREVLGAELDRSYSGLLRQQQNLAKMLKEDADGNVNLDAVQAYAALEGRKLRNRVEYGKLYGAYLPEKREHTGADGGPIVVADVKVSLEDLLKAKRNGVANAVAAPLRLIESTGTHDSSGKPNGSTGSH